MTTLTTAMDIDAPVALAEPEFSLESLDEPLQSFAKDALSTTAENAATNYDKLETNLRNHLLQLVSSSDTLDIAKLKDEWTSCWKLCIYLLEQCPDLDRFIRKLPFVLLEDVVECLPLEFLQKFWESAVDTTQLCSGPLWESPTNKQSHVLQYIRLQNALLQRLDGQNPLFAGSILMQMANSLPLSDRSAIKQWGSVSGRTIDYEEGGDAEEVDVALSNYNDVMSRKEQEEARTFHQVFWSLQQDMHNPYSISFGTFFQHTRQVLAALESKSLSNSRNTATITNNKYLTTSRLLPLQLQDATFVTHWLTQFLIIESFVSSQSAQLKTTLGDLSNRAKALMRKLPNGVEHLEKLQYILEGSETMWRTWKKNKCKPDMEIKVNTTTTTAVSDKNAMDSSSSLQASFSTLQQQDTSNTTLSLQDLQTTGRTMAHPSLQDYLETYVEALDPEAGIDAEYHPRNDALYCWRSLRLLGKQHLPYFCEIQKSNGDFERMVREIYKKEKNVEIPGKVPSKEIEVDYDEEKGDDDDKKKKDAKPKVEQLQDENEVTLDTPQASDTEAAAQDVKPSEVKKIDEEMKDSVVDVATAEQDEASVGDPEASDGVAEPKEDEETETPTAKEEEESEKTAEAAPSKPLTAFEKAAMEEEAILLAEHEEKQAAAKSAGTFAAMADEEPPPAVAKSEGKTTRATAKKDSKAVASHKTETTKSTTPGDDRKRKRESTYGSMADETEDTSKRSKANQGRSTTSDQSTQGQRRSDTTSTRDDRRTSWNASGGRGSTAARGTGRGGRGRNMPPARRSPPPPPPPPSQRGGRGRGGPVPGRGGRGGQRRDSRRRSY